ncbi:MAG: hypothetical protein LC789_09660, partial [Actinobacteria bacterium]|nr:hypothetical protein [Actinomycetota bacterium]
GRLVRSAADRVRVGGSLAYSVCTWTLAETVAVADTLVEERPELEEQQRVQWWPHVHATDGMFCATWVRRA